MLISYSVLPLWWEAYGPDGSVEVKPDPRFEQRMSLRLVARKAFEKGEEILGGEGAAIGLTQGEVEWMEKRGAGYSILFRKEREKEKKMRRGNAKSEGEEVVGERIDEFLCPLR